MHVLASQMRKLLRHRWLVENVLHYAGMERAASYSHAITSQKALISMCTVRCSGCREKTMYPCDVSH